MNTLSELINELVADGYSVKTIADYVESSESTVKRIRNDQVDPAYTLGSAIADMHATHCKPSA